jgi:UDP-N-acetylmuramate dehydrogenase
LIDRELKEIFERGLFKGEIQFDQPMSEHTSLNIGGPVDILVFPEDVVSLKNVVRTAHTENIPFFVLGAGTNLLVRDKGIAGIAVSLKAFKNIAIIHDLERIVPRLSETGKKKSSVGLFVEAGVRLSNLINFTKKNGFSGIEELAGIPGTFGGAVYMNAGSFDREIKDVIISISIMKNDGSIVILKKDQLKFSYRSSQIPDDTVIISANILLGKDEPRNVSSRVREFLNKKKQAQPIEQHSAGCVFKNPESKHAGRLIDETGCKGMRMGDVEVSSVHANYFINRGRATSFDFMTLMNTVKTRVKERSGITLEAEIKILGRDG